MLDTKSTFLKYQNKRTNSFKPNDLLNQLQDELKHLLAPVQLQKQKEFNTTTWPVGNIIGNPRTGSTLLLQWLSSLNIFSYPSNLLARFYYAPYIGALIQNMLFDQAYDFQNELSDIKSSVDFKSNLGKSQGALSTHEFQHFFRSFMPNFDPSYLLQQERSKINYKGIISGFATIEKAFNKPFITKNLMLQYHLEEYFTHHSNVIFFFIKRDPLFNMQSILISREKYYGTKDIWWSVKPKEYEELIKMDVYHQIAGQVYFTNKSIEKELQNIPEKNKIEIIYDQFCKCPGSYYDRIVEQYKKHDYKIKTPYKGPIKFNVNNKIKINNNELDNLKAAYEYFVKTNQ